MKDRTMTTGLIVGFDVDGVLADLVGDLCEALRSQGLEVTPKDVKHWDLGRAFGLARGMAEAVLRRPGFAANMSKDWPGVVALAQVRRMQGIGSCVAITAPMHGAPTWIRGRQEWLTAQGFDDADQIFIAGSRKHLVALDVLVEDHAANLANWCDANPNGQGFLIDRPWNQPTSDCRADHERMVRCTIEELPNWLRALTNEATICTV